VNVGAGTATRLKGEMFVTETNMFKLTVGMFQTLTRECFLHQAHGISKEITKMSVNDIKLQVESDDIKTRTATYRSATCDIYTLVLFTVA
jgi:hypothetical protein